MQLQYIWLKTVKQILISAFTKLMLKINKFKISNSIKRVYILLILLSKNFLNN